MHACRVHYYCLGVSQSCNNYYYYNHPHDDRTLLMVEADCVEFSDALGEPDCDCDNFDEDTAAGTFTCRLTTRDDGIHVTFTYDVDGLGDYVEYAFFVMPDGDFVQGISTFEGGNETMCTASVNGCPCECTVGMCPFGSEPAIVSLDCPNIPAGPLDLCGEPLRYALFQSEVEFFCSAEDGSTIAPSMGDTVGGTAMESADITMATT